MKVTVVGPTEQNLAQLRTAWLDWLAAHGDRVATPEALANADRSIPNLSSIVLLAEESGKRILLTGDARSDHIIQGLDAGGHLQSGAIHLDVLKLPHHGSDRNIDRTFFDKVTADVYVISANGKHGNPCPRRPFTASSSSAVALFTFTFIALSSPWAGSWTWNITCGKSCA